MNVNNKFGDDYGVKQINGLVSAQYRDTLCVLQQHSEHKPHALRIRHKKRDEGARVEMLEGRTILPSSVPWIRVWIFHELPAK